MGRGFLVVTKKHALSGTNYIKPPNYQCKWVKWKLKVCDSMLNQFTHSWFISIKHSITKFEFRFLTTYTDNWWLDVVRFILLNDLNPLRSSERALTNENTGLRSSNHIISIMG